MKYNNIIHLNVNLIKKVWKYSYIGELESCLFVCCQNPDDERYLWAKIVTIGPLDHPSVPIEMVALIYMHTLELFIWNVTIFQ